MRICFSSNWQRPHVFIFNKSDFLGFTRFGVRISFGTFFNCNLKIIFWFIKHLIFLWTGLSDIFLRLFGHLYCQNSDFINNFLWRDRDSNSQLYYRQNLRPIDRFDLNLKSHFSYAKCHMSYVIQCHMSYVRHI